VIQALLEPRVIKALLEPRVIKVIKVIQATQHPFLRICT
jgi:hypothetical protein